MNLRGWGKGDIKEIRQKAKKLPGTSRASPWAGHMSDQKAVSLLVSLNSTYKDPAPEFRLVSCTTRANEWLFKQKRTKFSKVWVLFLPWFSFQPHVAKMLEKSRRTEKQDK